MGVGAIETSCEEKFVKKSKNEMYFKIDDSTEISAMLRKKDIELSSRLIQIILEDLPNDELYLGGSVLKNHIYSRGKKYNDIDLLVVFSYFGHYDVSNFKRGKVTKNHSLYRLLNIDQFIPELRLNEDLGGSGIRYRIKNLDGTDFHIHFDYKKKDGSFSIDDYK